MTKKDFELIASCVDMMIDPPVQREIANYLATALASKNPRFNKDKFLKACGVEETCYNCGHTLKNHPKICQTSFK